MRVGLSFPNFGVYADPATMVALAVAAEEAGWDGFFVWDHIVVFDGMPVADTMLLLSAIGEATRTLKIGPMVLAVPRYRPWVLGRQTVTLDRLTGGRLILGVGIGYPPDVEFGTFGESTDDRERADKLDEALAIITGMWSGEPFQFEGSYYRVGRNRFQPVPIQQPRIPIWVAGMIPNRRPLRRAARFDGVYPARADMRDVTAQDLATVVDYVSAHRADPGPFDVVVGGPPDGDLAGFDEAGATWYLAGPSPEGESIEETFRWVSEGPPDQ
jgi:alkanesulfonate monooxygenase SsuD/methylene tetrahydromethanopterin reductase-like flavin-dependent oxidoreductase (luciferase family)